VPSVVRENCFGVGGDIRRNWRPSILKTIIQPRSLQQRTLLFILVPTFLLLTGMSVGGYVFVRNILLNQWGETAIAELQRTAHQIDMRMRKPKDLLQLLQGDGDLSANSQIFNYILKKTESLHGVVNVKIEWPEKPDPVNTSPRRGMGSIMGMGRHYKMDRFEISLPRYDRLLNDRTVSLVSELRDSAGVVVGRVEVILSFEKFIDKVITAPWWKSNKAYLIDDSGNVLATTFTGDKEHHTSPHAAFGTTDTLERDTLAAMKLNDSGMVFGRGSPPEEVSGFYRLVEAPWTMVIMAPGKKILQPIIRFKFIYILSIAGCILLILYFIRRATGRITGMIKEITAAAEDLAEGSFGPPLPVTTRDEVGELTRCFNKMTRQLKQRLLLKEAINVAREVQQNLLPHAEYSTEGVIVDGISSYCDETGGDYFDIIRFPESDQKVGVVVGDVVGHGIGAALLMTTVRALLRCRIFQPGTLNEVMDDVNTLLCKDTNRTGNFITLFYLEINRRQNTVSWVRGGHDPAIVYSPKSQIFSEFKGKGIALGVDPEWNFESNELLLPDEEQLILIGSDGVWEVENIDGEQFGKDRVRQILADTSDYDPDRILQSIIQEIALFKGEKSQDDDITLAVIKLKPV